MKSAQPTENPGVQQRWRATHYHDESIAYENPCRCGNLPRFRRKLEETMFARDQHIAGFDDEIAAAINGENRRQEEHVELIASENYASPRVMEAQGTVLTNKYAEGYPRKRYYGGCEYVDQVEELAIARVKAD